MKTNAYILVVILSAVLGAGALSSRGPALDGDPGIRLLSLSSPRTVTPNERFSVYGGLRVPAGTFEKRLLVCDPDACATHGLGTITGPGEWWGYLGNLSLPTGNYEVVLSLFRPVDELGVAVAQYEWRVTAH